MPKVFYKNNAAEFICYLDNTEKSMTDEMKEELAMLQLALEIKC